MVRYYPASHLCSFNHLPFSAVGEWIWKVVAGINPDDSGPGFKNVIIKPEPGGGITNAYAKYDSIHGPIITSWTNNLTANTYTLAVTVPANTTASVLLPTTNIVGGILESASPAITTAGVSSFYFTNWPNWTNGATVFQIGSGVYNFTVTNVFLQ